MNSNDVNQSCFHLFSIAVNLIPFRQGRPEVGVWGVSHPQFLRRPSVILCRVGKSLHNGNSVSVFRGSLKLKLSFCIDIVVGLSVSKRIPTL